MKKNMFISIGFNRRRKKQNGDTATITYVSRGSREGVIGERLKFSQYYCL